MKAEKRNSWLRGGTRENDAKETLGIASHVATVATFSRARAHVFIAASARRRGGERSLKEKEEGRWENQMELRTRVYVRRKDY